MSLKSEALSIRNDRGQTRMYAAAHMGITENVLRRLEEGSSGVTIETICRAALWYAVPATAIYPALSTAPKMPTESLPKSMEKSELAP